MHLAENPFSTALKAEHKRIGLWTCLSSNLAAEVLTSAGYDWALIKPVAHRLVAKGVPVGTLVMHTAFAAELQNEGFALWPAGPMRHCLPKARMHFWRESA